MIYVFLAFIILTPLFMASYMHYYNKLERNNIPISIIKKIETDIISNKYKVLDSKNITNIQLLHQGISNKTELKNEYCFIVRNGTKVYTINIELHKEGGDYISNYKSHHLLEKEIRLYFFYAKYVVKTFLGIPFLSRKTIGLIALITGVSAFSMSFILSVWVFILTSDFR